jgi:ABC-2 type transport system permease protein
VNLTLFFKLLGVSVRSQMQHRASFVMLTFAHLLSTCIDIVGIWVLFDRFKLIKGWSLPELAIVYGVVHMGFALAESAARGFDHFGLMLKSGDFDRVLLRPMSSLFQIAVSEIQLMRLGRMVQAAIVFFWGYFELGLAPASLASAAMALSVFGCAALFYALFIFQAALSFWTTESLELMNITTYGGVETAQYPMSAYGRSFRLFFTFVIPLACVAYYPVASALHKDNISLALGLLSPLSGFAFLWLATRAWAFGVGRYHSAGG